MLIREHNQESRATVGRVPTEIYFQGIGSNQINSEKKFKQYKHLLIKTNQL